MAKKFIIKDEDGKQFEITEETVDEEPMVDEEIKPEVKDDEALTSDEIAALKSLAARSADILKLLEVEAKEHDEDNDIIDEDGTLEDDDVCPECGKSKDECVCEDDEEEKEEVIETKAGDSKKSVGSIQKKKVVATDSIDDREVDIANAWANRFKMSYKKGE